MIEIYKWINDGLPDTDDGYSLEFGHLKSYQQDKAKEATAIMNEAINHALGTDFYSLNIEKAGVANSYFASVDKKGTKAQQLDLVNLPTSRALGAYEPDQFPRPVMVTVESETSHNIAVVLVCFGEQNFDGFGEWGNIDDGNQPEMEVFAICSDQKEANDTIREIANAYRVLEKTATLVADYSEKRKGGEADNGHAKGSF